MRLIENWARTWWRLWSVRLNAAGLALLMWVQIDPVSVLYVWSMMPAPVQDALPRNFVAVTGMALLGLSMIARLVRQPKLRR